MAVHVESPGQIQDALEVVKRRRWQILLPALFIICFGVMASVMIPRKYEAVTRVELRQTPLRGPEAAPVSPTFGTDEVANAGLQIQSFERVRRVLEELKWPEYLNADGFERSSFIFDYVIPNIKVQTMQRAKDSRSSFVQVEYEDVDGERAEQFLTALVQLWLDEVIDRDRELLERDFDLIQDLREEATQAWTLKNSEYMRVYTEGQKISLVQPQGGREMQDPVFQALVAKEAERERLQREIAGLQTLKGVKEQQLLEMDPTIPQTATLQGTSTSDLVAVNESRIAALEASRANITKLHSKWDEVQEQIDTLRAQIDLLHGMERLDTTSTTHVPNAERFTTEVEIAGIVADIASKQAQLEALDKQIAADEARYDERVELFSRIYVLGEERATAAETRNLRERDYNATRKAVEAADQPDRIPYYYDLRPMASDKPTKPQPTLIVAISVIAGLAVGLGLAFFGEYSKNCYRGVSDVTKVMTIPVLGVVNTIVTSAEIRRTRLRRAVVGLSSAVVLSGLLLLTWAWSERRELLPTDLVQRIEDVRMKLR